MMNITFDRPVVWAAELPSPAGQGAGTRKASCIAAAMSNGKMRSASSSIAPSQGNGELVLADAVRKCADPAHLFSNRGAGQIGCFSRLFVGPELHSLVGCRLNPHC